MKTAVAVIAVVLVAGAACVGADGVPANSGKGGSGGSGQGGGGGGGAAGQGGATGTGGASSSGSGGTAGGLGGAGGGAGTGGNMLPWTDGFEDMAFVTRAWRAADANGTWSVITDGSKVYQAVGSGTETIAVTGYYAWTDQDVTVKVKVTAAASSSWEVDLLPRLSDLRNYYQLTLTPTSLALHARVDNSRTELVTKYKITTPIATGAWHTLRFSIKNVAAAAQITAWLDATMALTFTDPMPLASGGVGLGVTNATVEFDDLSVTLPP